MANQLSQNPMILDTDFASYQAVQTLTATAWKLGLRIRKIALVANAATVAGQVTVTDPNNSRNLLLPMNISAGQSAGTILYTDDFVSSPPVWSDFAVTGLTATKTSLYIWFTR